MDCRDEPGNADRREGVRAEVPHRLRFAEPPLPERERNRRCSLLCPCTGPFFFLLGRRWREAPEEGGLWLYGVIESPLTPTEFADANSVTLCGDLSPEGRGGSADDF
jgi:hypothetical protein